MMNYIQRQNKDTQGGRNPTDIYMPLSGAAIGNGWIDPMYQYSAQDAAYGYGLIGKAQQRALAGDEEKCRDLLSKGSYVNGICFDLLEKVIQNSQGKNSRYTVSQYDQRKWEVKGKPRDFPPGHKDVEAYLGGHSTIPNARLDDVLQSIHATPSRTAGQVYYECTDPPYNALKHQDGLGVVPDVVSLLNDGVRMLFFNGIHDMICNHVGNENAVENFPWTGRDDFQVAVRYGWMAPSTQSLGGYMREHKNLQYLKVLDSGHMVPMDVPEVSLDMMRAFMFRESFQSYKQELGAMTQEESDQKRGNPTCPVCPQCQNDDDTAVVSCPVCDDCDKVCNEKWNDLQATQSSSTSSTTTSSSSPADQNQRISGAVAGAVVFLTLAGMSTVLWLFFLRRSGRRAGSSNPHRPVPTNGEYDMEMSKRDGSRFRDADSSSYSDNDDEDDQDVHRID
jgi:hypothetical protein